MPAVCFVLYFVLDPASGFMWPLAQRFVSLGAITLIPLCRLPEGARGRRLTAAALALAVLSIVNTGAHFVHFARTEVAGFVAMLDAIEPRSRVAALIFEPGSRVVNGNPFLHFGSFVQAEKGGVVQFSFAGYNHWPIDFVPGRYPPPGAPSRPRWEWNPGLVTADELSPYYDYVLVRGGPMAPPGCDPRGVGLSVDCPFERTFSDARWALWRRAR